MRGPTLHQPQLDVERLRANLHRRRAAATKGWEDLKLQREALAERDRLAQEADGRAPRRRRHEALLRALARETEREDQLTAKLQRDTLALQAAAAADVRSLGALLARAPWGGLSAAEAKSAAGEARALQEAKLALCAQLQLQAERAEAIVEEERERRLKLARKAREADARHGELLAGADAFRYEPRGRTHTACRVRLDLTGGEPVLELSQKGAPPLRVPARRLRSVRPAALAGAFRGAKPPPQPWLYVSVGFSAAEPEAAAAAAAAAAAGAEEEVVVHLALPSRAQALGWLLGLQEVIAAPAGGAVALSRGALLWTFVRLMVAERARETGLTPTQQWMEAILTAASDARVRDGSPPLRGRARA